MNDQLKKMFFMSMGMAQYGKTKMEEFARDYAEMFKKSEQEGEKFYNNMVAQAQRTQTEWEGKTKEMIEETLKNLNLATAERVAALEKKVAELEAKQNS